MIRESGRSDLGALLDSGGLLDQLQGPQIIFGPADVIDQPLQHLRAVRLMRVEVNAHAAGRLAGHLLDVDIGRAAFCVSRPAVTLDSASEFTGGEVL